MSLISARDIELAADRIGSIARRTPLVDVSHHAGRRLQLKCENLQVAGAFKIRGASNKVLALSPVDRDRGVITYSSGNHAHLNYEVSGKQRTRESRGTQTCPPTKSPSSCKHDNGLFVGGQI